MDLAHCSTLLIDLTLGEHLEILGERRGSVYKSGICDTKPAIYLKRSCAEPKFLNRVSIETLYDLSIDDKSGGLG